MFLAHRTFKYKTSPFFQKMSWAQLVGADEQLTLKILYVNPKEINFIVSKMSNHVFSLQ